jgi:hypothetical protein
VPILALALPRVASDAWRVEKLADGRVRAGEDLSLSWIRRPPAR